jgi:hypothetical protein
MLYYFPSQIIEVKYIRVMMLIVIGIFRVHDLPYECLAICLDGELFLDNLELSFSGILV